MLTAWGLVAYAIHCDSCWNVYFKATEKKKKGNYVMFRVRVILPPLSWGEFSHVQADSRALYYKHRIHSPSILSIPIVTH